MILNACNRRSGPHHHLILTVVMTLVSIVALADDQSETRHQRMLKEIAGDFRRTAHLTGRGEMQEIVESAIRDVPRHEFVSKGHADRAYVNRPLSIGHGQTISQPYIVALMTDLLDLESRSRVLEIGTGSGYQAAVLAEIASEVFTIEIVDPLAKSAEKRLQRLGYDNIQVRIGDGNYGWPEAAPFDGIIVTAGGRLPPVLVEQLKPGGRMVIPINLSDGSQELIVLDKNLSGEISQRSVLPVRFVPITGEN
jgi:protein-L-isoaspartate(D-aspartate) O-methyltransferase